MRKAEEVADPSPLYQAKKENWRFTGVLAYSKNYFRRSSAFNIIHNLEIKLAQPEQLTEKVIPLRKDIHIHMHSVQPVCSLQSPKEHHSSNSDPGVRRHSYSAHHKRAGIAVIKQNSNGTVMVPWSRGSSGSRALQLLICYLLPEHQRSKYLFTA